MLTRQRVPTNFTKLWIILCYCPHQIIMDSRQIQIKKNLAWGGLIGIFLYTYLLRLKWEGVSGSCNAGDRSYLKKPIRWEEASK